VGATRSASLKEWKNDSMGDSTGVGELWSATSGDLRNDAAEGEGLTQMRCSVEIVAVAAARRVQTKSPANSVGDTRTEIV